MTLKPNSRFSRILKPAIAFFALVIAIITIYEGMSEINKFFNERIKI